MHGCREDGVRVHGCREDGVRVGVGRMGVGWV